MKKAVFLLVTLIFVFGCASKVEEQVLKKRDDYERQNNEAANAFNELDGAPAKESGLGSESYNRQTGEAAKAQNELECAVSGKCPAAVQPVVPEKPKPNRPAPITIDDKASPGSVQDKAAPIKSAKYPLVNGLPVWFSQPGYDGYIGGVGVAKPQSGGYGQQKRAAVALAQADLIKSVSVNVYNESTDERYLVDTKTAQFYKEKFTVMSRHDAGEYIENPVVMDEWVNVKTGELYIWVVLPR